VQVSWKRFFTFDIRLLWLSVWQRHLLYQNMLFQATADVLGKFPDLKMILLGPNSGNNLWDNETLSKNDNESPCLWNEACKVDHWCVREHFSRVSWMLELNNGGLNLVSLLKEGFSNLAELQMYALTLRCGFGRTFWKRLVETNQLCTMRIAWMRKRIIPIISDIEGWRRFRLQSRYFRVTKGIYMSEI